MFDYRGFFLQDEEENSTRKGTK